MIESTKQPKDKNETISAILAGEQNSSSSLANSEDNDMETNEDDEDDEQEESLVKEDFSGLSKTELVSKAAEFLHHPDIKMINEIFQQLRNYLDEILRREREKEIVVWVAEGNEARDFRATIDGDKDEFYQLFQKFQDRRKQQRNKAQEEREKNLRAKENILEKIKILVETEEIEGSLDQLRDLQREWKNVRQVPREQMNHLWETYRYYLDRFYDNLTINNELKELDRQKNLEQKIDLCLKVNDLKEVKSVKTALILLNKYHEEFKNVGPVPSEATEEIWMRFKATSDEVLNLKKEDLNNVKEERKDNLVAKVLLCEKVEQSAEIPYGTGGEWNKKTKEISDIFDEWKKIGPAPKVQNDIIWKRFRDARDVFYERKKVFFGQLNSQKGDNLKLKQVLCEKAEALKGDTTWGETTRVLIEMQKEWKEIGPVPDPVSQAIWKRFRTACDGFFKSKEQVFKGQKEEELENYNNKLTLIKEVIELLNSATEENVLDTLKDINTKWNTIGFVPFKQKDKIYKDYQSATDEVYHKFKKNKEQMQGKRMQEHYSQLTEVPNGSQKLKDELRRVNGKIINLNEELKTIENNIAFFSNSKNAEKVLKPFEDKIKHAQILVEKLKEEKKFIQSQINKSNE